MGAYKIYKRKSLGGPMTPEVRQLGSHGLAKLRSKT